MKNKILLLQNALNNLGIRNSSKGMDLVIVSHSSGKDITIKVLARSGPAPAGGKGALAIDWWIGESIIADVIALIDLSTERIWIFNKPDIPRYAQQHPPGRYHLYMYTDRNVNVRCSGKCFTYEFNEFLIENNYRQILK